MLMATNVIPFGKRKNPYDNLDLNQQQRIMEDLTRTRINLPTHAGTIHRLQQLDQKMLLLAQAKVKAYAKKP